MYLWGFPIMPWNDLTFESGMLIHHIIDGNTVPWFTSSFFFIKAECVCVSDVATSDNYWKMFIYVGLLMKSFAG